VISENTIKIKLYIFNKFLIIIIIVII